MLLILFTVIILMLIGATVLFFKNAGQCMSKDPVASFICIFSGIWTTIFSFLFIFLLMHEIKLEKYGYDLYTLRLYYVGGSEETTTYKMTGTDSPYIDTSYGKFNLTGGECTIPGVVRFEVLSVKNIKE